MVKQWRSLNEESVGRMEQELRLKSGKSKIISYKAFREEIASVEDLIKKTPFLE